MAAGGYPGEYEKGKLIAGIEEAEALLSGRVDAQPLDARVKLQTAMEHLRLLANAAAVLAHGRVEGVGLHEDLAETVPGYQALVRAYELSGPEVSDGASA